MAKSKSAAKEKTVKYAMPRFPNPFLNPGSGAYGDSVSDTFQEYLNAAKGDGSGTALPFLNQMMGDFVLNPSSVSLLTYHKMVSADPTISGSLAYNFALLGRSVGPYYNEDKEKQDLIRRAIKKLEGGLPTLVRKMCGFMVFGFYTGEKVWEYSTELDMDYISDVLSMPQISMTFAVDYTGRVKKEDGIWQSVLFYGENSFNNINSPYEYGNASLYGTNTSAGPNMWSSVGDLPTAMRTIIPSNPVGMVPIPRENCIYLKNEGVAGSDQPYGISLLRPVYSAYLMKAAISQFLMIVLDRQGTPMIVCYADGTQSVLSTGSDPDKTVDTLQAIGSQLEDYRGTNVVLVPGLKGQVYELDTINVTADIQGFIDCLNWCEKQIQRGLLMPDTVFQGDTGGSYASNSMANNVHNKLLAGMRDTIMHTLVHDYVKPMLDSKYDELDIDDYGYFKEEILSLDDQLKMAKQYQTLFSMGVISNEQLDDMNIMRESQNFPQIDEAKLNEIAEAFKEQMNTPKTNIQEDADHYKNQPEGEIPNE